MTPPLPFTLSLPHCSSAIPPEIAGRLAVGPAEVARSADLCTGRVFGELPAAAVVAATCSRLAVDLNRAADDRRPLGVIPRTDYWGNRVWQPGQEPDDALRRRLLEGHYRPYHRALGSALETAGCAGLIDCHSLEGLGPANAPDPSQRRMDVTLGNLGDPRSPTSSRRDTSCPAAVLEALAEAFVAQGFSVSLNRPYSGGFITASYGPALRRRGQWAVQLELNEDLYQLPDAYACDERKLAAVRGAVGEVLRRFADRLGRPDRGGAA